MSKNDFLKLQPDHRTVLVKDMTVFNSLRDFLLNSGYIKVYETPRVGEEKTAMATFACRNLITGDCLAVVYGISASDELAHPQAPFVYGGNDKKPEELLTYVQHLALRTSDIFKLKEHLEKQGAQFLTPVFQEKDSFGPLLQCFTRELFDDEWFFIELVQRDYNPGDIKKKTGEQFSNKTVQSLYSMKQEEFREWQTTKRKPKMFEGNPEEVKKKVRDFLGNMEPKDFPRTVPCLKKIFD